MDALVRVTLGMGCSLELDGYQCHAYSYDYAGGPQRDVTGLAAWSTSDTSIATVNSVGFVTVLRKGQAAVRASYRDKEGFITMDVEPGGSRRYYRALSGWVRDSQGATIPAVNVTILDGANAGRSAMTGPEGAYQMYDLEVGTFTVRFSKAGYKTIDTVFALTGTQFNGLDARLERSSP